MTSATEPGSEVIVVDGDMDALTVKQLRSRFEEVVENDHGDVVVDMSQVPFIDSSGIGALVFLFKRLTAAGRALEITGVHGQPRDLFAFLRIDKTIAVRTSDEASEKVDTATAVAMG